MCIKSWIKNEANVHTCIMKSAEVKLFYVKVEALRAAVERVANQKLVESASGSEPSLNVGDASSSGIARVM